VTRKHSRRVDRGPVRRKHPDDIRSPAVHIEADVKAKEVRFKEEPRAKVSFSARTADRTREEQPEVEAGSVTERENIPEEVEAERTYRDVRVRWHAAARIKQGDEPDRERSDPQ
jgi:hypothetical protein